MTGPAGTNREREALRSFARRIDPSDAGAHNNLGVLYYNKGLYEDAVAAFTRALELDPKMQVAQRNLEVAYLNTGYYDRRVAQLRERLRTRVDDRDARWELGRAYALLGQYDEAIAEFETLLRHHPDDLAAITQLGLAEKARGNLGDAQRWFEESLRLDPDSSVTHFTLAEIFYNQGRHEDALKALERAIALNPENPDAHFLLSFVYGDMGRHEEARAASKRAVQLNPALSRAQTNLSIDQYNPQKYEELLHQRQDRAHRRSQRQMQVAEEAQLAHYNLGVAFRQKGYYTEALREYRLALDRGEDRDLALQAMAEVHLLRKDTAAALELYDQLVAAHPDRPKLWNERGLALHQDSRHAEAAQSYRKAVEADPSYAIAYNNLGVAMYHLGDRDAAVDAFRQALEKSPGFVKARLNMALLLTKSRRYQLALEAYRKVLTTEGENPVAWNGIGLVLAELRKFEDARNAYARAIQARPEYAEAHYNLSFALSNLGDFEGALRETKRALELDPFYVAQKFELAIDLEFEDPDLSIQPDLGAERRVSAEVESFSFDPRLLDTLFTELAPAPEPEPAMRGPALEADPYAMATDYLRKGLFDRAMAEASRALNRGADAATGHALLGDILCRQGAYGDALEKYRIACEANPAHTAARRGQAQALLMLGRGPEAREVAERLLDDGGQDADTLMLVASCRFEAGDPAAALEALDTARAAAPGRADVLRWIGNITRSLGDVEGAIAAYRHALALDADFAVVRFDLARLLMQREAWAEAEAELNAALDAVPTYTEATLELAALKRRTGRPLDAVTILADLLQRDAYNFDAMIALGETLLEMRRMADAAVAFRRVLAFDADNVGAIFYEGVLLAEQKRYREAIARWERVVDLEPAGEFARRARREARSAADLLKVFGDRHAGGGASAVPAERQGTAATGAEHR